MNKKPFQLQLSLLDRMAGQYKIQIYMQFSTRNEALDFGLDTLKRFLEQQSLEDYHQLIFQVVEFK